MRITAFRGMMAGLALALSPMIAAAQGAQATPPNSAAIVIIDQERLLTGSRYGQRIQQEVEEAGAALVAENRRIEAQLSDEELRLTEQRATMSADAFRPLAQEFNIRVEGIRAFTEGREPTFPDPDF